MKDLNQYSTGAYKFLQEQILSFLKFRAIPSFLTENTIQFQYMGLNFLILFDDTMTNYFRLSIPNVLENYKDNIKIYKIIDRLNAKYKVVKAFTYPSTSSLWIVAEQFVESSSLSSLFDHLLSILSNYYNEFKDDIIKNNGK